MTTQEKLERIKAKCQEIIALGEKRTQGRWKQDRAFCVWSDGAYVCDTLLSPTNRSISDADFIAACAGPAEAMAKSTIAAIGALEMIVQSLFLNATESGEIAQGDADVAIQDILAAWPDECFLTI